MMKKYFSICLCVSLFLAQIIYMNPAYVQAEDVDDSLEWDYELVEGQAKIIQYKGEGGAVVIPERLGGLPVTEIGDLAFRGKGLTSIQFPESLVKIGALAFAINELKVIVIPNQVTSIGEWAFEENQLTSVTLGSGLTEIAMGVFKNNELRNLVIPEQITMIRNWSFQGNQLQNVLIENAETDIENTAIIDNRGTPTLFGYANSKAAAYADFKDFHFTTIEGVYEEDDLHYLDLGTGQASITQYTGSGGEVIIPGQLGELTVTEIWGGAFIAKKLTGVKLPDSLTTIGFQAFASNALTTITIPDGVTSMGDWAFERNHLLYVQLGSGLSEIPTGLFANNHLMGLELPDSVTDIGEWAFERNLLRSLKLPAQLKMIHKGAFQSNQLMKLSIPASAEHIGQWAFLYSPLRTVIVEGAATTFGHDALSGGYGDPSELMLVGLIDSAADHYANDMGYRFMELRESGDYHFIEHELGEAMIVDYTGPGGSLFIPDVLDNLPVTHIGASVFILKSLTDVRLPAALIEIHERAFQYNSIAELALGSSLEKLGNEAFLSNPIKRLRVPEQILEVGKWAFLYNPLTQVILERDDTVIGPDAFKSGGEPSDLLLVGHLNSKAELHADEAGYRFYDIATIPGAAFSPDGNHAWQQSDGAQTAVEVWPDVASLHYRWSQDMETPQWNGGLDWTAFASEDSITLPAMSGTWFLHIRIVDIQDQTFHLHSQAFYIDNDAPSIFLSASPTAVTKEKVTVTASVYDNRSGIVKQRWGLGAVEKDFFALYGTDFETDFEVQNNDLYTVYAEDAAGNYQLSRISISNISLQGPTINLGVSTYLSTNENVTVTADVYTVNELSVMKFEYGKYSSDDLALSGQDWDLSPITMSENGWVSVYVQDIAGHTAHHQLEVKNIDRVSPVIELIGPEEITLYQGESYVEHGVSAMDDVDGDITDQVKVSNVVNTRLLGVVKLQYDVSDQAGNAAEPVFRTVNVIERESPNEEANEVEQGVKFATSFGGELELSGVTILLPADAVNGIVRIKVEIVSEVDELPNSSQLASQVYEITKDDTSSFHQKVKLTVPFDKSSAEQWREAGQRISLFWLDEEADEWMELDAVHVDWQAGTVSGEVDHFTKFAVLATEMVDSGEEGAAEKIPDIAEHWANQQIVQLVQAGSIIGYPDGTFKPDSSITRAEFITMLMRSLSSSLEEQHPFDDVDGHWAEAFISAADSQGIVRGYPDGTFKPDALLRREEMAIMLVHALGLLDQADEVDSALDLALIPEWARQEVWAAATYGLLTGDEADVFKPEEMLLVSRAEAAAILVRALTVLGEKAAEANE